MNQGLIMTEYIYGHKFLRGVCAIISVDLLQHTHGKQILTSCVQLLCAKNLE